MIASVTLFPRKYYIDILLLINVRRWEREEKERERLKEDRNDLISVANGKMNSSLFLCVDDFVGVD